MFKVYGAISAKFPKSVYISNDNFKNLYMSEDTETAQPTTNASGEKPWGMDLKTYCTLMHLSQFAGFLVPFAGLIMPIVMWTTSKDKDPSIDQHGKNILNWMISVVIYAIGGAILTIVFIGILVLIAVGVCSIIFTIMGAVKASKGEVWAYPMSIKFFK